MQSNEEFGELEFETTILHKLNTEAPNVFLLQKKGKMVPPNQPFYVQINANKIMDGLFIGNQEAAQEIDFISTIKCTNIINCAGHSVPNLFVRLGVKYLTLRWLDCKTQTLFDSNLKTYRNIIQFIEPVLNRGEAVFIHSQNGNSRAVCVCAAYLMHRFHWSAKKSIEFIKYRRPEIQPKPYFVKQLRKLGKKLKIVDDRETTVEDRWLNVCTGEDTLKQMTVRNTFLNGHFIYPPTDEKQKPRTQRLRFANYPPPSPILSDTRPKLQTLQPNQRQLLDPKPLLMGRNLHDTSPRENEESQPESRDITFIRTSFRNMDPYQQPKRLRPVPAAWGTTSSARIATPQPLHQKKFNVVGIRNHAWEKPKTKVRGRKKKKRGIRTSNSALTLPKKPRTKVMTRSNSAKPRSPHLFQPSNLNPFFDKNQQHSSRSNRRRMKKSYSADSVLIRPRKSSSQKKKKRRKKPGTPQGRKPTPQGRPRDPMMLFGSLYGTG